MQALAEQCARELSPDIKAAIRDNALKALITMEDKQIARALQAHTPTKLGQMFARLGVPPLPMTVTVTGSTVTISTSTPVGIEYGAKQPPRQNFLRPKR